MKLAQSYRQPSTARTKDDGMGFALATDLNRPGVFLNAGVKDGLSFSRNMLALHRIVCTNMIKIQKDHSSYQKWVEGEYFKELGKVLKRKNIKRLIKKEGGLEKEIKLLKKSITYNINESRRNFFKYSAALGAFWGWLRKYDYEAWVVLDPVVSVQPDAVIFEAFSLDESMYGRVTLPNNQLQFHEPLSRGTTNIDFSQQLANEFDRVRSYRPLDLKVGYKNVEISTNLSSAVEKKIDLPESWLKGFLEVQSASAMPKMSLNLTPATVSDLIAVLEQKKDNVSPKSLKFILEPGKKPWIEIEPWGIII
ncbi:MAG: SWIM zinc finger family protein, partial [Verrucomicrobiota bacterium]|nr:SWIM zinc finger family protein [Verrucomicrobiota bacterium]